MIIIAISQWFFWLILLMMMMFLQEIDAVQGKSKEFQLVLFLNKLESIDWEDEMNVNQQLLRQEELQLLADYQVSPFREMVDLKIENNVESSFQESMTLNQLLGPFPRECGKLLPKAFSLLLKSTLIDEHSSFEEAIQILKLVSFFSIKQPRESVDFRLQKAVINGILQMKQQDKKIERSFLDFLIFELTLMNENLPFHPQIMQIDLRFPFPKLILQFYSLLPEPLEEIRIEKINLHRRKELLKILAKLIKKSSNHLKRLELIGTFLKEDAIGLNLGSLKVLQHLNLENNFIQEGMDFQLQVCLSKSAKTLRKLNLAGNFIHLENFPLHLYLSNLEEFELSGNYFAYPVDEEILAVIQSSPKLKVLGINSLNSWKPVRLAFLFDQIASLGPNLQVLRMKRCMFREALFSFQNALKNLTNLQHLELEGHPVHSILHVSSSLRKLSIDSFTLSTFEMQFLKKAKESFEHLEVRCNFFEFGLKLMFYELFLEDKIDSLVIFNGGVCNNSLRKEEFYKVLQRSKRISHLEIPFKLLPIDDQCNEMNESAMNSAIDFHHSFNTANDGISLALNPIPSIESIVISLKNEENYERFFQKQLWIFPNCKEMKLVFDKLPRTAQLSQIIQQVIANAPRPFRLIFQGETSEFFSGLFQSEHETGDFQIIILVEEIGEISLWEAIKLTWSKFLPRA